MPNKPNRLLNEASPYRVVIHHNLELTHKLGAGSQEAPHSLPTKLQHHGNPVHIRNIWVVDYGKTAKAVKPVAR